MYNLLKKVMDRLKNSLNQKGMLVFILMFFGLFMIFLSPVILWKIFNIDIMFSNSKPITDELNFLYYVLITTITAIIALFTYKQFKHFNESLKADYLLKIDARWCSAETLKARTIIHTLYLRAKNVVNIQGFSQELIHDEVGKEIIKLSEGKLKDDAKKFIYVLSFIDFMETIGYFYSRGQLSKKDLIELFGDTIKFNYEVCKPYIEYKRKKHNNKNFYKEFEKLYLSLLH